MNSKKIIGIIIGICGIAMILFSIYISNQVGEGKVKASKAQSQVDTGSWLFSQSPATKEVGKALTGAAQSKIDEGQRQITYYEGMAKWLLIGGIGFIVIGGVILFYRRKPSI
jgi:hypothetical protein